MDFQVPEETYVIFTKKKCSYCTRAKVLLPQARVIPCDHWLKQDRGAFLARMDSISEAMPRTFPMVFVKGKYIGGYDETKEYVDELECFKLVDF
jgi:glutaredoxin